MTNLHFKRTILSLWPILLTYAFISLTYSAIFINMINISELIWDTDVFETNGIKSAAIISIRSFMWAFSGVLFGNLADRFSRKTLLIISSSIVGVSCILFSRAPLHLGNKLFYFFMFANAFSGIGLGGIYPIIYSYTNDYLEDTMTGKFYGAYSTINLIMMNIGMIIAAWAFRISRWRSFFGISGMFILGSIVFLYVFVKEPPRAHLSSKKLAFALKKANYDYNYRMNKKTFQKTILSKSNILTILEGIFTCILFEVVLFLIIPYLEQKPYNIDESSISVIFVIFAAPGALISSTFLAHQSDKWASKDIRNRVSILVIAVVVSILSLYLAFLIPLKPMSKAQGKNLGYLFGLKRIWLIGLFIMLILMGRVLYLSNQPPVIQAINLPETQGFISSVNQFLEILASAIGPLFGAAILAATQNNYKITALLCGLAGVPGVICWIITRVVIKKDIHNIEIILHHRADEITKGSNLNENFEEESPLV